MTIWYLNCFDENRSCLPPPRERLNNLTVSYSSSSHKMGIEWIVIKVIGRTLKSIVLRRWMDGVDHEPWRSLRSSSLRSGAWNESWMEAMTADGKIENRKINTTYSIETFQGPKDLSRNISGISRVKIIRKQNRWWSELLIASEARVAWMHLDW